MDSNPQGKDDCYDELHKLLEMYQCSFYIHTLESYGSTVETTTLEVASTLTNVLVKLVVKPTDQNFDLCQLHPLGGIDLEIVLDRRISNIPLAHRINGTATGSDESCRPSQGTECWFIACVDDIVVNNGNLAPEIKDRIKHVIYGYVERQHQATRFAVYQSLKFLEKHLCKIFSIDSPKAAQDNVVWSLQEQKSLEFALARAKQYADVKNRWNYVASVVKTKSADECRKRFLRVRESIMHKQQEAKQIPEFEPVLERSAPLRLVGLELEKISTFTVHNISMEFGCIRCGEKIDFSLDTPSKNKVNFGRRCGKCNLSTSCQLLPKIAFAQQPEVFDAKLENCNFIDWITAQVHVTCEQCDTVLILRDVKTGCKKSGTCRGCFSKHTLYFDSVEFGAFERELSVKKAGKPVASTRKRPSVGQRFKVGTPLPDNGACKHYMKSHRWFRFPCCGKLFPCDVCHDEKSSHPCDLANIIVCGHCSTQQAASNKRCKSCGRGFTSSASAYWEGGKGCRDATLLSRRDSKKYKLMKRQAEAMAGSNTNK